MEKPEKEKSQTCIPRAETAWNQEPRPLPERVTRSRDSFLPGKGESSILAPFRWGGNHRQHSTAAWHAFDLDEGIDHGIAIAKDAELHIADRRQESPFIVLLDRRWEAGRAFQ
jgi:hypothetical protein